MGHFEGIPWRKEPDFGCASSSFARPSATSQSLQTVSQFIDAEHKCAHCWEHTVICCGVANTLALPSGLIPPSEQIRVGAAISSVKIPTFDRTVWAERWANQHGRHLLSTWCYADRPTTFREAIGVARRDRADLDRRSHNAYRTRGYPLHLSECLACHTRRQRVTHRLRPDEIRCRGRGTREGSARVGRVHALDCRAATG
jgi:hypothetical protein